jgi:hypothetical protein
MLIFGSFMCLIVPYWNAAKYSPVVARYTPRVLPRNDSIVRTRPTRRARPRPQRRQQQRAASRTGSDEPTVCNSQPGAPAYRPSAPAAALAPYNVSAHELRGRIGRSASPPSLHVPIRGAFLAEHDALKLALASQYRIERELGRGGFATVFLAHDLRHDRPVAVKVLHPDIAASLGSDRFKREIRLAARLQHPHILGVHDSGETDNQLWFTMPFVEGESLPRSAETRAPTPCGRCDSNCPRGCRRARLCAPPRRHPPRYQAGKHSVDRRPCLADFGIARALRADSLTQTGVAIGTPAYMSPEQSSGSSTVDARTDVYALGCVLYEMLAGEPPFTGPTPQIVISRALTEQARPIRATRPTVSAALEGIIARAMARVPADRFASAAELGAALAQVAGELRTPAAGALTAPPAGTRPQRQVRTALAAAGSVVLLIAVGLFGWFGWSHLQSDSGRAKRLAVLPFENLGAADDDYFAEGIADDVRGKLAALPDLQVIARASAIQYKNVTTKTPQQIAEELGVDYLLTGTVRWERGQGVQRHDAVAAAVRYRVE